MERLIDAFLGVQGLGFRVYPNMRMEKPEVLRSVPVQHERDFPLTLQTGPGTAGLMAGDPSPEP